MNNKLTPISLLLIGLSFTIAQASEGVEPESVPYLAKRGGGDITVHEFDARMSQVPEEDHATMLRDPNRMIELMKSMLLSAQLAAAARDAGLDEDPVIAARMGLAAEGVLAGAWMGKYLSEIPQADYEAIAQEIYLTDHERMKTSKKVDVTHLLVSNKSHSRDEARELAKKYLDQARENPALFDDLVKKHSEDPSVIANKGRFTGVGPGDMVEQFEKASFALEEIGSFSPLVETPYGFHIIRLDGVEPPRQLSFEETREQLVKRARYDHRERFRNRYLSELAGLPVDINDDVMQEILIRYVGEMVPEEQVEVSEQADQADLE